MTRRQPPPRRFGTPEKELLRDTEASNSGAFGLLNAYQPVESPPEVLESLRAEHPDLALLLDTFRQKLEPRVFLSIQEIIRRVSRRRLNDHTALVLTVALSSVSRCLRRRSS